MIFSFNDQSNTQQHNMSTTQQNTLVTSYKLKKWVKFNLRRDGFLHLIWNPHPGVRGYLETYLEMNRQTIDRWNFLAFYACMPVVLEFIRDGLDNIKDVDSMLRELCLNPSPDALPIIQHFEKFLDDSMWACLSQRDYAVDYLKQNPSKIDWDELSGNPSVKAIEMLRNQPKRINWTNLSTNPAAIALLEENVDKINWSKLSSNPNAEHLLRANIDRVDWKNASMNEGIIALLSENLDKVQWEFISQNKSAEAIIRENIDKCSPFALTLNPCATFYIENNTKDIVHWNLILMHNDGIFEECPKCVV